MKNIFDIISEQGQGIPSSVKRDLALSKTAVSRLPNDVMEKVDGEEYPQEYMSPSPGGMGSVRPGDDPILTGSYKLPDAEAIPTPDQLPQPKTKIAAKEKDNYRYDPGHRQKPVGPGWRPTKSGWSKPRPGSNTIPEPVSGQITQYTKPGGVLTQQTAVASLLKIAREMIALSGLRLEHSNRGSHHNQSDDSILAYVGDERVGYLDYSEYQGEVQIQMIEVSRKFPRQGIATAMLQELDRLYPDIEIDTGMMTPEGSLLFEAYYRRHPKKLDFEGGVSNKDFVLSLVPDFGKNADKISWHNIAYAFSHTDFDLRNYDMSYAPDIDRFRKDVSLVSDEKWAIAAKKLRSGFGIKKNSDL